MTRHPNAQGILREWERPREGRLVAGVCCAIGERTGVHPMLVRLAFVVLALAKGVGVLLYALLWLILPDEDEPLAGRSLGEVVRRRLRTAGREAGAGLGATRTALRRGRAGSSWPQPLNRWWIGVALAAGGALLLTASFGLFDWITPTRAFGLAAIAYGIGVALGAARRPERRRK